MSRYNKISALRRLGNKNAIADQIIEHFPDDFDCLISLFYGTGSLENRFLGKIKYIIANDLDDNVYNFYLMLTTRFDELYEALELLPYHESAFKAFRENIPDDPVQKAVRFLMLSNWSLYGAGDTMRFELGYHKETLLKLLQSNFKILSHNTVTTTQFMNCDFRKVIAKTSIRPGVDAPKYLLYSDPPYLDTSTTYNTPKWTKQDVDDLFQILCNSGMRFAMSEFDHPYLLQKAKKYGLNVIYIRERQALKKRATEILITNYKTKTLEQKELF
jgi:DNA adenine methylase